MSKPRSPGTASRHIAADSGPWPLHDIAATRRLEAQALAAHAPHTLMLRAGSAVARLALAVAPQAQRVLVLAGPGNNGGDGLVAARLLHGLGLQVQVLLLADPARQPADAARANAEAVAAGVPVQDANTHEGPLPDADVLIDALLGLGASHAFTGPLAALLARARDARGRGTRVLAIDLPSGLDADRGSASEGTLPADWTLALLTLKPGLHTHQGRDLAGDVWLDTLGLDLNTADASAWLAGPWRAPLRAHATHKGIYGDVIAIGGAAGMGGALWLAGRAALAAGAGRVYLSARDTRAAAVDPAWPELMSQPAAWSLPPARLARSTVLCGCGGGEGLREVLPPLLRHAARLLLDADALNAVAAESGLRSALRARAAHGLPTVLTPHPLEAARLLGLDAAEVQADRLRAAQTLADQLQSVVVLKGSGSVIATPAGHGQPVINPSGNAALATAGTGDVLAGWIAGHWSAAGAAHGASGEDGPSGSASAVACAARTATEAVWWHGNAADRYRALGHHGPLRASALIEALMQAG